LLAARGVETTAPALAGAMLEYEMIRLVSTFLRGGKK
jgi:hypothetical protein